MIYHNGTVFVISAARHQNRDWFLAQAYALMTDNLSPGKWQIDEKEQREEQSEERGMISQLSGK